MRLAVIGSRTFNNYALLKDYLDLCSITCIVSGGANGADKLGERYAKENNIPTMIFLPDWNKYGKRAGFMRNIDIVDNADFVIAFWDGVSRGTLSSIKYAQKQKKGVRIVEF